MTCPAPFRPRAVRQVTNLPGFYPDILADTAKGTPRLFGTLGGKTRPLAQSGRELLVVDPRALPR